MYPIVYKCLLLMYWPELRVVLVACFKCCMMLLLYDVAGGVVVCEQIGFKMRYDPLPYIHMTDEFDLTYMTYTTLSKTILTITVHKVLYKPYCRPNGYFFFSIFQTIFQTDIQTTKRQRFENFLQTFFFCFSLLFWGYKIIKIEGGLKVIGNLTQNLSK